MDSWMNNIEYLNISFLIEIVTIDDESLSRHREKLDVIERNTRERRKKKEKTNLSKHLKRFQKNTTPAICNQATSLLFST